MTKTPSPMRLSPFDHVMPPIYTTILLFVPENGTKPSDAIHALRMGLVRLISQTPLLGGSLQHDKDRNVQKGTLQVAAPWHQGNDLFYERNLQDRHELDYCQLQKQGFPTSELHMNLLAPKIARGKHINKPILFVQANVIKNGIILSLGFDHKFTDGRGMYTIAQAYAACCRGQQDVSGILGDKVLDRTRLLYGSGTTNLEEHPEFAITPIHSFRYRVKHQIMETARSLYNMALRIAKKLTSMIRFGGNKRLPYPDVSESADSEMIEKIVFLPSSKLVELKSMATQARSKASSSEWISTNDAICSLLTCCLLSARQAEEKMASKSDEPSKGISNGRTSRCASDTTPDTIRLNDTEVPSQPTPEPSKIPDLGVLGLVIDVRRHFEPPLPSGCLANVLYLMAVAAPLSILVPATETHVADFSLLVRQEIQKVDEPLIRGKIAALASVPDISRVAPASQKDVPPFIKGVEGVISWWNHRYHELDMGPKVGEIERVRVCHGELPETCCILPEIMKDTLAAKTMGPGMEILITKTRKEIRKLKRDELLGRFAVWLDE